MSPSRRPVRHVFQYPVVRPLPRPVPPAAEHSRIW
jgi:hypothetical protein